MLEHPLIDNIYVGDKAPDGSGKIVGLFSTFGTPKEEALKVLKQSAQEWNKTNFMYRYCKKGNAERHDIFAW